MSGGAGYGGIAATGASESVPKAFVSCTTGNYAEQFGGDPVAVAAHARGAGWTYRETPVGHAPQVFDAEGIARLMIELANQLPRHLRAVEAAGTIHP